MNMLQIPHAGGSNPGYLGYHLYHAPGASVQYSTAAAAPDGSRSFCLSRDKLTMQELNKRLASYLQQIQYLEEDNHRLELLIQEELSKKSPTVLRELDKYLGTVSQLQEQINERLSAQAQVKLELLSAEVTISLFNTSCEREMEHCARLEAGINNLRLLGEELMVRKLPELQSVLNDETEELMELEVQYQQEREVLLAQVSGDVDVELQNVEPSHLVQQLDAMRHSNAMMHDQEQDELWYKPQVAVLSPLEETFNPAEEELMELRAAAAELEEELRQLQAENILLENSGEEIIESFVLQLVALQQRADELCRDLDSVQQTAAQQACDYHTLLDIKNRLETEIHDYKMLLDGLNQERVSSLHLCSRPTFLSSAYPAASEIFMPHTEVSAWGGNHQVADTWTVRQTPAVTSGYETVTANQSLSDLTVRQTPAVTSVYETVTANQSVSDLTVRQTPAVTSGYETVTANQSLSDLTVRQTPAVTSGYETVTANQSVSDLTVRQTPAVTSGYETVTANQSVSDLTVRQTPAVTSVYETVTANQSLSDLTVRQTPAVTSVYETVTANQSVSAHTTHPLNTTLTSIEASNLAYSLYNSSVVAETELQQEPPSQSSSNRAEVALEVVQEETSSEVSLMNDEDIEKQLEKEDKEITAAESALLVEEVDTGSITATVSLGSQVSNNNLESTTASTDILETLELGTNEVTVVKSFPDTNEVKVAPVASVTVEVQETLLSTTESKTSASVTDSGVALSSSVPTEQSSAVKDVLLSSTKTDASLTPGVQRSSAETQVLLTTTAKGLCPVVTEEHIKIETEGPVAENDDESCLDEKTGHVRSGKTCTVVTKEKDQSVSFSGEQVVTGESCNSRVTATVITGESLSSGVSPGDQCGPEDQKKTVRIGINVATESGVVEGRSGGKAAASLSHTVLTSSGTASSHTEVATAGVQGKTIQGGGEWMVYGSSFGHRRLSTSKAERKEGQSEATDDVTSRAQTSRFGKRGSGDFMVYTSSVENKNRVDNHVRLPRSRSQECQSTATRAATIQPEVGRFGRTGSMESVLYVTSHRSKSTVTGSNGASKRGRERSHYGGSTSNISDPAGNDSLLKSESEDSHSEVTFGQGRRHGSWGSGEWRVYGGASGRLSRSAETVSGKDDPVPSNNNTSGRPRLSSAGSGGKLGTSSVVRRSNSAESGGQLFTSGSSGKNSSGTGSYKISSSGSGERKPVYSSASGRRSTSQRAQSPRRINSGGSGGWLNTSAAGGNLISSAGSGSKLSGLGTNDKISSRAGGRTMSSGGRVISSSDGPVRSTGSGTGSKKERISVCKMAALSISAAGRERSQDRQRQQHQQQQAAATSPLIQRWLTTSVPVSVSESDGLDDIMHL